MKNIYYLLILINLNLYGQTDTISFNDVNISVYPNNKKVYFYKQNKFSGIIKEKSEDSVFIFKIKKGKLISTNHYSGKIYSKSSNQVLNTYNELIGYFDLIGDNKEFSLDLIKEKRKDIKKCKNCDTLSSYTNKYYRNDELFTGKTRKLDTIFEYKEGVLSNKVIYNERLNSLEFVEYNNNNEYKSGKYLLFKNEKLIVSGLFSGDKKTGNWIYFDKDSFDEIHSFYVYGKENGIWLYYRDKKIVKSEYYNYGFLDYYYISSFKGLFEYRDYYNKNNICYAKATYKEGSLMEYDRL